MRSNLKNNKMKAIKFLLVAIFAFCMVSCLTVEKKHYVFEFTDKNSGTLTITYMNIFSQIDDSTDISEQDFNELIDSWVLGSSVENNYPLATNFRKRLYEENGQLYGEIKMDFEDLSAVRLFRYDKKSPVSLNLSQAIDNETFINSNGQLADPDYMNVVFWSPKEKKLELTTSVQEFNEESCVSLIEMYRKSTN